MARLPFSGVVPACPGSRQVRSVDRDWTATEGRLVLRTCLRSPTLLSVFIVREVPEECLHGT
jgi:hypothetical protein